MNNTINASTIELTSLWFDKLKSISSDAKLNHIDIILDQAGFEQSIIPALIKIDEALNWFSLLTGMPEEGYIEQGPLLIRFEWNKPSHVILLKELLEHYYYSHRILAASSRLPFEKLSSSLLALSEIEWGNQSGLLRFYDTRIFPELIKSVLTKEQSTYFSNLVYIWGWIDRDGEMSWLQGNYHPDVEKQTSPTIKFSDKQFSYIGCISDIAELMKLENFIDNNLNQEENFSALYSLSLQAHESDYLGDIENYILQHRTIFSV